MGQIARACLLEAEICDELDWRILGFGDVAETKDSPLSGSPFVTRHAHPRRNTVISFSPRLAHAKYGISVAVIVLRSAGRQSWYNAEVCAESSTSRQAGIVSVVIGISTASTSPSPCSSCAAAPAWKTMLSTDTQDGSDAMRAVSACSRCRFAPLSTPSAQ